MGSTHLQKSSPEAGRAYGCRSFDLEDHPLFVFLQQPCSDSRLTVSRVQTCADSLFEIERLHARGKCGHMHTNAASGQVGLTDLSRSLQTPKVYPQIVDADCGCAGHELTRQGELQRHAPGL